MATFDQLPADQRAIIELVVKRGRTYDALSDMLDMPASRVRELARDALTELAPNTAERVDPDWRDQVADYVLGQQSGPESTATRGHLSRSEPARAWILSLLDSLDQLYGNGRRPEVPEPEAERGRGRDRRDRGERDRERDRRRERDKESSGGGTATKERDRDRGADRKKEDDDDGKKPRTGKPLSPAARSAVMRRRLIAGGVALGIVLLALVLILTLGGDDDDGGGGGGDQASDTTSTNANQNAQPQLIGQLELSPVGKRPSSVRGVAGIAKVGNENQLVVQAQLPPKPQGGREAYEVWLWNSNKDAISIGAQNTDQQGVYQGAGKIPADYAKYKYIDISAEPLDNNRAHSGRSVLRGELANLQAPPQQGQNGQGGQGGQGAPAPAPSPSP